MKAALLLLLGTAALAAGCAAPGPPPGCPANARELPVEALYGDWQARIEGEPGVVSVRLGRHPEYAGVRGTVTRADASVAQVAGDVDDEGTLALDESRDGRSISGVWSGTLRVDACGRAFTGTWRDAADDSTHSFTLTKTERTAEK
ncbi:hypothetical protein M2165_002531 [Variovorax sp. TBS-050B]|uniref:hypothetical protein n=1 Tax=Variovorax sp. TBS-050B TaxID=2940551 RepID=UPI00247533E4|nr:hypothetical protein [Variovorax sp. TBS-050B]MDH6592642.1 hypothetical protein [Variovorax sp. TBS-050B]